MPTTFPRQRGERRHPGAGRLSRRARRATCWSSSSPLRAFACIGLNGGPAFKHSEAFSFQIATETQEETDRYWNAIVGNGGQESECGWCKDKWGLSWQITPRVLMRGPGSGWRRSKARLRRDDDDAEDRRRCDRRGTKRG